MEQNFFHTETALNGNWQKKLPAGQYRSLLLRLDGTNNASNDTVAADINVVITVNSTQIINVPGNWITSMNDQWFGHNEYDSTTGAAVEIAWLIPFEIPGFPNGLRVTSTDNVIIEIQENAGLTTHLSSGSFRLTGIYTSNPQNYLPAYYQRNYTSGSGTTVETGEFGFNNIFGVWVQEASAGHIDDLVITRDGITVVNSNYENATAISSFYTRSEGSLTDYPLFAFGDGLLSILSSDVRYQIETTTNASVSMVHGSVIYDPKVQAASVAELTRAAATTISNVATDVGTTSVASAEQFAKVAAEPVSGGDTPAVNPPPGALA